jgi:hypothetical protein
VKVYSYYNFQVCIIQENDGPIYRTRVGDNQIYSLIDIHSIINIIHNRINVKRNILFNIGYKPDIVFKFSILRSSTCISCMTFFLPKMVVLLWIRILCSGKSRFFFFLSRTFFLPKMAVLLWIRILGSGKSTIFFISDINLRD